jgi:hypothetical protein
MFGVAGGVFVLLVVLAFMTASAFHSNAAKVSGQSGAAGASASSSASAQPTAAPAHWVTLPANSGWADSDFPTFFPQTPQGAAAMVAASAKYGWTLDQGQDVQAAELYTVPSAQQASVAGADQLPAQLMKAVGVDSSTTPAGLSVTATPVGVQWTAQSTTAVQVSLLVRLNASATGANTTAEAVLAVTTDVVWTSMPGQPGGGDWRMTLSTGRLPTPAAADVGTVAFNTAGWLAITNTGSAG